MTDEAGTMWATWTAPNGEVVSLTNISPGLGWFTTQGPAGWGATPIELVTDPIPRGGESVRFIRFQPRRITWPLHVYGETHQEFTDRYRTLMRAFTMTSHRRLPGTLTITRPDGSARKIQAYYEAGFGGEAGENWKWANPVLTLFCPDGFWTDVTETVFTGQYLPAVSFLSPFFTLSTSQVLGSVVATNPGDTEAWPTWTITGPMTALTATNSTLNQSFVLTHTLLAGEQITITTHQPTVRGPGNTNLTSKLDWPSAVLWPLAAGANNVSFSAAGASAGTKVQLKYFARFEGA